MPEIVAITELPNGARFFRGDLHVHSFGNSHDVKDATATPVALVTQAIKEGLAILAITDHNEIGGVSAALNAAKGKDILVVPGVELSTPQGHLLCYLPTLDALNRFHATLSLAELGSQNSRCQTAMLECLEKLKASGGFALLAHVDGPAGLDTVIPGGSPHKIDILCHPNLLGIELKGASSVITYSDSDPESTRASVGKDRIAKLGLGAQQFLARVLNSDSHTLNALGRNAAGDRKITRYKMNTLSFDSLRHALDDNDARVRIEEEIPKSLPFIRGIQMAGGFLDGQRIHFSHNLNCVIGGRGTGKSTTFEAIRCLVGGGSDSTVVDSDVWPDQVDVLVEDQAGQIHNLTRARGGDVENPDDPFEGPISFPIECYGQGETQQISQRAQTDPTALLDYLDRFINIDPEMKRDTELRQELLDSQTEIEKAKLNVESIPQYERDLALAKSQIKALEKANAKDIIALQRNVEQERQVRASILKNVDAISTDSSRKSIKTSLDALKVAADPAALVVGADEFRAIVTETSGFESALATAEATIKSGADKLSIAVKASLTAWRTKEQAIVKQIDDKKKALEAQGIRVDMAYIQKLAADEARLTQDVVNLKTWVPALARLWTERKALIRERAAIRARIATSRSAFAAKASQALRTALIDLNVTLKFDADSHCTDAHAIIVETMGWRTLQVPRASVLVSKLTLPKLLEALAKQDTAALCALKTDEGATVFTKADATSILERLNVDAVRFRLERCEVSDRPRLTVTKLFTDKDGKTHPRTREFKQLSLGQQQSVLLALMLSTDSNMPLIIDQPEDNLDSEFIYQSIVPVLRRAKERRQIIVITHNANIAVLGDAEQIVVLRGSNERAVIASRGSIDDPETRESACKILEGSREAFERRARTYGSRP